MRKDISIREQHRQKPGGTKISVFKEQVHRLLCLKLKAGVEESQKMQLKPEQDDTTSHMRYVFG